MTITRGLHFVLLLSLPLRIWADDLEQTITFTLPTPVTAGTSATLNGVASSGLPVSYQSNSPTICTVAGNQVSYLIAGTCSITARQGGNNIYDDAPNVTRTTTVVAAQGQQPQTISFTLPAQASPNTTATVTANASSGLPITYNSSTPTICSVTGTTVTFLAPGTCTITGTQAGNQTYAAATAVSQSSIVITPGNQPQTISFALPTQAFPGNSIVLSGRATSGLPVQYTSATPSVCTIANNSVNFVAPGTCTVEATQPGNQTYAAAPPVTQSTIVVAPVPTLGEWGMLGLAGLMVLFGMAQLKQRSEHGL